VTGSGEGLTFVFPMHNEEDMIRRTVAAACATGRDLVERRELGWYEIVVVDDASTDDTGPIAEELAAGDERVRVFHHAQNQGLGGAVRTGFRESKGDLVLYTDADMPFDLSDLGKALRLMATYDADMVSAYRFDRTGEGARRALYSYVYNTLVKSVLRLRIRDVNFAFKLLRRRVVDTVSLESTGSFIDVELLAKADRLGFHIVQFGVDYFPRARGASTLSSMRVIRDLLREFVSIYPDIRATRPRPGRSRRRG
jgi:glycosyltransferase involved in cell wall biosynthesis